MGVRRTEFACETCDHEWWETFEHLSKEGLISFAESTTCPECGSDEWVITNRSQFAGGRIKPNPPERCGYRVRGLKCRDCIEMFHIWLGEISGEELVELVEPIVCPECGSEEWELGDYYKFIEGDNPEAPIYFTMVNSRDTVPSQA